MNEERRKTDRRVPPAVVEFAVEERQQLLEKIADQAREIERLKRAAQTNWNEFAEGMKAQPSGVVLPEELFDGHGVYSGLSHYAKMRTSPENVSDVLDRLVAMMRARLNSSPVSAGEPFQSRVLPWLLECFGETIASDVVERNHRFLEEALELVQACGCPAGEAHKLVDYVYGRPVGEKSQEVGGVMVTLAALCLAQGLDMHQAGETELARITHPAMVERIRDKQKRKPAMSPLPGVYPERESASAGGVDERAAFEVLIEEHITLLGFTNDTARAAQLALTASAPNCRTYTTTPGEAVAGIALRQLGDESRWVEIRDLNAHAFPDIGPHDYYPVGTELRLPDLSAPNRSEQVREGWQLVPKVATRAMKNAIWAELDRQGFDSDLVETQSLYCAGIAAAPSAGSQGGDV